jgi:hypothetical protein
MLTRWSVVGGMDSGRLCRFVLVELVTQGVPGVDQSEPTTSQACAHIGYCLALSYIRHATGSRDGHIFRYSIGQASIILAVHDKILDIPTYDDRKCTFSLFSCSTAIIFNRNFLF